MVHKALKDELDKVEAAGKEANEKLQEAIPAITQSIAAIENLCVFYREAIKDPTIDTPLVRGISKMLATHTAEKARIQKALDLLEDSANFYLHSVITIKEERSNPFRTEIANFKADLFNSLGVDKGSRGENNN